MKKKKKKEMKYYKNILLKKPMIKNLKKILKLEEIKIMKIIN